MCVISLGEKKGNNCRICSVLQQKLAVKSNSPYKFKHQKEKAITSHKLTYPFVEQESKDMRCKGLAPQLDNQIQDGFSTLRNTNIIISKHIIKTQLTISTIISRRNQIFFPAENYICISFLKPKMRTVYLKLRMTAKNSAFPEEY